MASEKRKRQRQNREMRYRSDASAKAAQGLRRKMQRKNLSAELRREVFTRFAPALYATPSPEQAP